MATKEEHAPGEDKGGEEPAAARARMEERREPNATECLQKIVRPEEEWRQQLTPEQFEITRRKGTERAFTGKYYQNKKKGIYLCVCCGNELFSSDQKYDSGSGWPSFWAPVGGEKVSEATDTDHGMMRTEIKCSRCDAHLGHVFPDGPQPTNLRYCVNSASLDFKEKPSTKDDDTK